LLPLGGVMTSLRDMDRDGLAGYVGVALAALLPFAFLVTVSLLIRPVYVLRYVLPSLPFFLLLLAAGLCELRSVLWWTGFAVLVSVNLVGTFEYYLFPSKPPWSDVAAYFGSRVRPGDKLAIVPFYEWFPFKHYLSLPGTSQAPYNLIFPATDSLVYSPRANEISNALAPTYSRLWIITMPLKTGEPLVLKELINRYKCSSRKAFGEITVALYATDDCISASDQNSPAVNREVRAQAR
jgi:hypothetical protein